MKKQKSMRIKNNKGITLIALVITIIVLLILAAVAIATLTGENGLLKKVTNAKEANEIAEEMELIKLAFTSAKIPVLGGQVQVKTFDEELSKNCGDKKPYSLLNEEFPLTVEFLDSQRSYIVYENGEIEKIENEKIPDNIERVPCEVKIDGNLTEYCETLGPVTFVYKIEGRKNGIKVYEDLYSITFFEAGQISPICDVEVPEDTEITVTELNAGKNYKCITPTSVTKTINSSSEEPEIFSFAYEYDYGLLNSQPVVLNFENIKSGNPTIVDYEEVW